MALKKKRIRFIIIIIIFFIYFLAAARPVPREIMLNPEWLSPLDAFSINTNTDSPENISDNGGIYEPVLQIMSDNLLPFSLGARFGFVDSSGNFALNRIKAHDIYLSRNMWTEYTAEPENIVINNILNGTEINIENAGGYPVLLDDRIFIFGSDQNSLSAINDSGNIEWTYDFGAPLTAIDAASGLIVTGSLDGVIEVFNSGGERIYIFEPGGSRYSIILGCAISRNGLYIGIICGIDQQRFLLLERTGNNGDYMVIYHEFLEAGFRRPARVLFIDGDQRVIYERTEGIGCYSIKTRRAVTIPLDGGIAAIDESGENGILFLITSHADNLKKLTGIRFPQEKFFEFPGMTAQNNIFMKASFKSNDVFLRRADSMLVIGGGTSLISFRLSEK